MKLPYQALQTPDLQGDFWDSRVSVPHQTLNKVRKALKGWERPTIALVGNHDQTSFSGEEHGMHILSDINPKWTIISEPALAGSSLWLPYR
jgi:hypothetical protein